MKKILTLIIISSIGVSCARQITSDVYDSRQVGEVSMTYPGVIKHVRPIMVENGESLDNNTLGMATGGVAGGVIGSAMSKGHFAGQVAGGLIGAFAGAVAEKKMKQQTAFEYIVELDDGALMTVVQGQDETFDIGQSVYLMMSPNGRSRIIPRT